MGLCKCPKRKVTNLFCFEHDVNVCENCLVADHERCIVQSYVQWLQDSEYDPICTLCNKLLKDEPTVRLTCYDVFHWSCIDKYGREMPDNTAPAGYQCPKCSEPLFPPANLVSPVADMLREKLKTATDNWSRSGLLGQTKISPLDDSLPKPEKVSLVDDIKKPVTSSMAKDDFVMISKQQQQQQSAPQQLPQQPQQHQQQLSNAKNELKRAYDPISNGSSKQTHMRTSAQYQEDSNETQFYDTSIGMVLNDRDTGEYKYQRRPLFEWLSRWLKSRQLFARSPLMRMTRRKKTCFIVMFVLIALFTLIVLFSRLGRYDVEDDPVFDPFNNPNIRVKDTD